MSGADARRMAARINELVAASDATSSDLEPRLARGDRPIDAWIDDLRKLLREPSYRVAATSITMLAEIVDDVKRRAVDRVAAAVALATDDDGRARVRVAARGTADPDLRAALEQIAEDERPSAALVARIAER